MTTRTMDDAPLTPAGRRILAAASDLFYARGIRGVGVDLIAERAGTTKKTLYDRFGSKDALVARYLQGRAARWQRYLDDHLDSHAAGDGADRVLAVYDAVGAWAGEWARGCAFVNAYAEIGGTDHPGVAVIRADKEWMRARFVALVDAAGYADAAALGGQLHLLYEGALVAHAAGGQDDAFRLARAAAERLLGSGR